MDERTSMIYQPENPIPDEDFLFTRVNKLHLSKLYKTPLPNAFRNTPFNQNSDVLSSDWEKYISAEMCRNFVKNFTNKKSGNPKNPDDYFIWKMNVGRIRTQIIPSQEVEHTPRDYNRAHSSIRGRKPDNEKVNISEFISIILEIGTWEIAP